MNLQIHLVKCKYKKGLTLRNSKYAIIKLLVILSGKIIRKRLSWMPQTTEMVNANYYETGVKYQTHKVA